MTCLRGMRQGMQLQEAEALVKGKRSQAHPYIDCWKVVVAPRRCIHTVEMAHPEGSQIVPLRGCQWLWTVQSQLQKPAASSSSQRNISTVFC